MPTHRLALILFATRLAVPASFTRAADALPAPTHANVAYGSHERQVLDYWHSPSANGPAPVVVFVHGGGFRSGDKRDYAQPQFLAPLLAAGVSCASINYRYVTDATVPEILRDVARAVQFLRSQAPAWNLDAQRMAGWGGSAGACAVFWLGVHDDLAEPNAADPVLRQSSRLSAVVLTATQATIQPFRWEAFVEPPPAAWRALAEEMSARNFGVRQFDDLKQARFARVLADCDALGLLDKSDAAVFCINVTPAGPARDFNHWVHHPCHAAEIHRCCTAAGVPCTVSPSHPTQAQTEAVEFLKQQLKRKPRR